jgi:predicted transposase YdaD
LPPAQLLRGGLGTLPLAPISAVTEAQLPGLIRQMEKQLRGRRQKDVEQVWSATFILLGLQHSPEFVQQLLRGVRSMKESSTYQAILEEGEAKEARKFLTRLGSREFGPPSATVQAALEGISDVERLEQLGLEVQSQASWEDLLGLPAPRQPRPRRRPKA